jgi:hypothetical protein
MFVGSSGASVSPRLAIGGDWERWTGRNSVARGFRPPMIAHASAFEAVDTAVLSNSDDSELCLERLG